MITNPPPYDRAPTLNATQTRAPRPPRATAGAIRPGTKPLSRTVSSWPRAFAATSMIPQPARTRTSQGPIVPAATPPGGHHRDRRAHGDGRDGGTGSCGRPLDPQRRVGPEEQRGQPQDDDEAGDDEAESAHQCTEATTEAPGAIDGELRGGGPWEEVGCGDAVF